MWVKICANTNLEDALQAAEAGADAVGFVFAPSKRQVTPEQVGRITARLPAGIERVGVFASEPESMGDAAERITRSVDVAGLTAVQMHRGLDLRLAEALRKRLPAEVSLIHTVHWKVDHDVAAAEQVGEALRQARGLPGAQRVLVDAKVGHVSGGLGVAYDWTVAARVLMNPGVQIIVAGGLRPETVADAIRTLKPYGVDVASGVEREPGRKDYARVAAFIEGARSAL